MENKSIRISLNDNSYLLKPLNNDGELVLNAVDIAQIFQNSNVAIMSIAKTPQVIMDEIMVEIRGEDA